MLATIEKQQQEIDSLKNNIKDLENKLNQKEKEAESIASISSKMNKVVEEAEQYLTKIKEAHNEINEYLKTIKSANKSDFEENAGIITNEEKLKETNENINEAINDNTDKKISTEEIIDTKDESQIDDKSKNEIMLIPIGHTDLAIIEPILIKVKRKKILLAIIYALASIIIVFSLTNCYKVYSQDSTTTKLTQNLQSYISESISNTDETKKENPKYLVNFDELKKINSDTCGWIQINGIDINMPVVQADNNEYYLKYSFDKSYNLSGWAFVDYRDKLDGTDKNIIIYGHNRRDNIMFSPLINIIKPDWYNDENNKYITFISEDGKETIYEVCSIYQTEVEDYYIQTDFSTEEEHQKFLDTIKSRSIKKYDVNLNTKDQILTLSTCGNNSKYRVILHAKKI